MAFLICIQLTRHPFIELFHLSSLLQMPNDLRMVSVEFFGNFSCSYKKNSFSNGSQLVIVNFQWPATMLLISRLSFPLQNFLNHHCTVHALAVPGPNVLLMLLIVSTALWPILNLNKKRQHFKMTFFKKFLIISLGTHLWSFFTFSTCFKCQMT